MVRKRSHLQYWATLWAMMTTMLGRTEQSLSVGQRYSVNLLLVPKPTACTHQRGQWSHVKKGKGFLLPNNCAVHLPLELWSLCRVAGILMWASRMRKMWGEYATLRAVLACLLQIFSISLVVVLFSRLQCFTDCHRALRACVRLFRRATMMMMTAAAQ